MEYRAFYDSPVGTLTLVSDGTHLTELWLPTSRYRSPDAGDSTFNEEGTGAGVDSRTMNDDAAAAVFDAVVQWLDSYFAGERPDAGALPLQPYGTQFRQEVWKILQDIPYGEVTTYGNIAAEIARSHGLEKMSSRAVGGAVGHNPISIIIPCHRVVGSNGSLTGYGGGIPAKIALLQCEGVDLPGMHE